jgi:O-methyltransferase
MSLEKIKDGVRGFFAKRGVLLVRYAHPTRRKRLETIAKARNSDHCLLLNDCDAAQLISAVTAAGKIPGALAEVGVAYGGSARLISEYGAGKILHLFDTFGGLPKPSDCDSAKFSQYDFSSSVSSVRKYLEGRPVVFHQGLFPDETGAEVEGERFSFLHLDVDLYESTLKSLRFFYPRMSLGGIILSHDFVTSVGVNRAFEEFFADKPEAVLELTGYQCMVVKVAGSDQLSPGHQQMPS